MKLEIEGHRIKVSESEVLGDGVVQVFDLPPRVPGMGRLAVVRASMDPQQWMVFATALRDQGLCDWSVCLTANESFEVFQIPMPVATHRIDMSDDAVAPDSSDEPSPT